MSIPIRCDQCGHEYQVNDALAGKRVKCKQCARPISVPKAAAGSPGRPKSPMRHVYRAVAALIIGLFGVAVYLVGRNIGLWGEVPPATPMRVARELTPAQKLEKSRKDSQWQLELIDQSLHLYAGANRGNYPARLGDLLEVTDLSPQVLVSPFAEGPAQYTYLHFRAMGTSMPLQTVVAYDQSELSRGEGGAVLYASGKVAWLPRQQLEREIEQSDQRRMGLLAEAEPEKSKEPKERKHKLAKWERSPR